MKDLRAGLEAVEWRYGDKDPEALAIMEQRIARAGRYEDLVTYSDLVAGITFRIPNVHGGKPFQIQTDDWSDLDRAVLGDMLGYISLRSFRVGGFLASTLAVNKANGEPSQLFFRWMNKLGAIEDMDENTMLTFWVDQVKKAHAWYKSADRAI